MKKFAFIFGVVLIAAILVAAGFGLGYMQRFMVGAYSVTALDKSLSDASIHAMVLHSLDSGHVDDARSLLRFQLDSDRSRKMAINILSRIATDRAEYPAIYTNRTSEDWEQIDTKISDILTQARKAATK